jgi:histidinol-phosphate phosphatase family protein
MARLATRPAGRRKAVFLDRDGVINRRAPEGAYIRNWDEFEFTPGAITALRAIDRAGGTLFVVTNQRGVARGLIDPVDLADINSRLVTALSEAGVSLGGVYTCPHEIGTCDCRKPDVGLFMQAQAANPWIDFDDGHMVGDSLSDLEAGHRLGLRLWAVGESADDLARQAALAGIQVERSAPSIGELVGEGSLIARLADE